MVPDVHTQGQHDTDTQRSLFHFINFKLNRFKSESIQGKSNAEEGLGDLQTSSVKIFLFLNALWR